MDIALRTVRSPFGAPLLVLLLLGAAPPARGQILNTRFLYQDPLPVAVGPDAGRNAMAIGDLNGDQHPDLVVIEPDDDRVGVFRGLGDGRFERLASLDAEFAQAVAIADVASPFSSEAAGAPDGIPDLLVGDDGGVLTVWSGAGDGTFATEQVLDELDIIETRGIATGEFDGVAGTDVALIDDFAAVVLCNDGGQLLPCGDGEVIEIDDDDLIEVAALDLDGDGKTDLATLGGETQRVVPLFGRGDGTFEQGGGISVQGEAGDGMAVDMAVARVDDDATDDLLVVNYAENFELLGTTVLGRADRRLRTRAFVVDFQASALAAADFDGVEGGGLDVVVGYADNGLSINVGDGFFGFFDPFTPIGTNRVPAVAVLATADLDVDGRPDLVALSGDGDQVVALLNVSGALCPGDCNVNNEVTIEELMRGVSILLGDRDPRDCLALERDGRDGVTVSELVAAVNSALDGCSAAGN